MTAQAKSDKWDYLRNAIAKCKATAPTDRKEWYGHHSAGIIYGFSLLAEEEADTFNELLHEFLILFPPDQVDLIREKITWRQYQNAEDRQRQEQADTGSARHNEIVKLQQAVLAVINNEMRQLPTSDDCWQYVLDHAKAVITPLAKLWVIEQSASEAIIERLLPLLHKKDTKLRELIKAEARTLRQQDYGSDLDITSDGLQRSNNGSLQSNFFNAHALLANHLTAKVIGWDLFHNTIMWKLKPIWETDSQEPAQEISSDATGLGYRAIHESDLTNASRWLNHQGLHRIAYDTVRRVIRAFAYQFAFNSLHDYLARYRGKWDSVDRLGYEFDLVGKLFGTKYKDDNERKLCNVMLRKQLIGWIERGLHPGCEFRTMLHLIGDQRVGKSRWVKSLGGPYYVVYRRKKNDPSHADNYTQMIGFTIGEIGESSRLREWNYEVMKENLSTTHDNVRKPYAEDFILLARQWVTFGTSNNEMEFLTDPTGNSRHFPIKVDWNFDVGECIPIEWFELEIREQLLAQLIYLVEMAKEPSWLDQEQSLVHKEYVRQFEMKNDAVFTVEEALKKAFVRSGIGESLLEFPGIRFDELYAYLKRTEKKTPMTKAVKEALLALDCEFGEVVNVHKLGSDKRENRWYNNGSRERLLMENPGLSKEDIGKLILARTDVFPLPSQF